MLRKILKISIIVLIMSISNRIYADTNDSILVKNRYENIYAVHDATDRVHLYYAQRYTLNGVTAYCIEPGLGIDSNTYSSTDDWQITNLSEDVRNDIRLIAYYGYDYPNHNTMKYYLATQELIWDKITKRNTYWVYGEDLNGNRVNIDNEKETILNLVKNHTKTPSFDNQTIEVNLNEEKVITDENHVLDDYEIYSSNIPDTKIIDNKLQITVKDYIKDAQIKLIKKHYTTSAALIYYNGNNQKMMRSGILDPVVALANVKINIKTKVKVTKIDKDYKYIIKQSNIKFKIKNLDTGEYICESEDCLFKTNDEGWFITNLLSSGNYQIEEIENQDIYRYLWNQKPLAFSIDENSQIIYENNEPVIKINFPNKQIRAHIRVTKVGEKATIKDGQIIYEDIPLDGVMYKLYANEDIYAPDGTIMYKKYQRVINFPISNGAREIQYLPLGKFCLEEISTLNNYILPIEPYCFELEYKDRYTTEYKKEINLKNYLAKGSLSIIKKSSTTNLPLNNAKINVYTENNELVYQGITDNDGKIALLNIPIGKYYYKEIMSPEGYLLDNQKHYFEIKENEEIITEEFINESIKGTFEFKKIDYNTNLPLSNTVIEIYNETDELLYSKETNEEGKIVIENIPYGKYYFKEKIAPKGYSLDTGKYYFEIKENDAIIYANMTNERIKVPNTYLNESFIIYLISILGIIASLLLITRKRIPLKILGVILIVASITISIYKRESTIIYTKTTRAEVLNYINNTSQDKTKKVVDNHPKAIYNYIAILEIPSINLKRGLVNKYSKYNDVKYNVQIIDGSNMPDVINSNLVLAAHSGNSRVAYFKDLINLKNGDEVFIYYNGTKYIYKINNHYEVIKTGYIDLERDKTINAITLITCKDDDYQIVYLGYLISKELY